MPVRISYKSNIPALTQQLRDDANRLVVTTANQIRTDAVTAIMNPPKSGRVYKRQGKEHIASAPGEAPATDTGFLANSITVANPKPMQAVVQVGADYGEELELGGVNTAARPYLTPAFERAFGKFMQGLAGLFR